MKKKTVNLSLAIVTLFSLVAVSGYLSAASDAAESEGTQKMVIAYSNNVEGYLEPCG